MPAAGVYKKEIDLSLYVEIASNLTIGVVHTFNKGPVDSRTLITNSGQLETTFGKPIDDDVHSQGFFALREYFRNGNQAYVVRVESSSDPSEYSECSLRGASDDSLATGTDGATSVPATREMTSATGDFVNDGVQVGDILEIDEGTGDDGFYVIAGVTATVLTVDRDFPTGSLSTLDFTVWSSKLFGADDGATSVASTRQLTSASATFQSNGVQAGDVVYVNDTGDEEDNGFYVVESVTSETVLVVNRPWPVGEGTGLTFTVYGRNHLSTDDGDTSTDGEFEATTATFQSHGVKAGDILIIEDAIDTGDNGEYVITGLKSGSEETTLEVNVAEWATGSLTGLSYRVVPGVIKLTGESKGSWANGYELTTALSTTDPAQFDLEVRDAGGFLVETIFGLDTANVATEMANSAFFPTAEVIVGRTGPGIATTATASGGEDGTTGISDADFIGTGTDGLQAFKNIEEVTVDILLIPGYSSQNIGDALINMAEYRGDCMALVDSPDYPTVNSVQDVIDWHNGLGGFGRTTSLSSSYAALAWTWQQIYDPYHDKNRWTAPSGHVASAMANSENQTYPWFAPAGLRRGKFAGSIDVRLSPDSGQRNAMQLGGNSVNPVVKFIREGIHLYGQKTLLRTSSALNRINVRRLLLFLERGILEASRLIVFEPGDEATDREFIRLVTPVLEYAQDNRGLREFLVVAASTDIDRDNQKLVFQIFIKPTKAAEVIEVQFILTAQTANFAELLAA